MQRLLEQLEHLFREIKSTGLTIYVKTCKGCLSNQDILPETSEALDLQAISKHEKVV
jgi:hypothetical protein